VLDHSGAGSLKITRRERSGARPILQERSGGLEEGLQDFSWLIGERCFVKCTSHQVEPTVASRLSDGEGRVTDAQPGMAALFDVGLGTSEAADEKIAQALLRAFQIVRRVHWPENIVGWHLPIKCIGKALKSGLADR
jgi:hypothetical protein